MNRIVYLLFIILFISSCNQVSKQQCVVIEKPKQVKLSLKGKKIILYGDSMSSDDYTWYKSAMEEQTGAEVYAAGFSGNTTASLAKDEQLQCIFDYEPDLIVILVGGNDIGRKGHVGTFGAVYGEPTIKETDIGNNYEGYYFIESASHLIRKVQTHYYNIRERANLTGDETEAEKETKIDAVKKPYIVVCTPTPQQRIDNKNPYSNPDNWLRKRNAIVECCNRYNVHCVDLYSLLGWDMSLEPYWMPPTDAITNNGVYTMDGLHPNKYGYQQIASIICGEIGIVN